MTAKELQEKAGKRYHRKVDKAQYHNDLIDAALEYITALNKIIEQLTS